MMQRPNSTETRCSTRYILRPSSSLNCSELICLSCVMLVVMLLTKTEKAISPNQMENTAKTRSRKHVATTSVVPTANCAAAHCKEVVYRYIRLSCVGSLKLTCVHDVCPVSPSQNTMS